MHFPQDAKTTDKLLLLGALFLVNYMYYEDFSSGAHHRLYSVETAATVMINDDVDDNVGN